MGSDAIKPFSACGFSASRILCPRDLILTFEMVRHGDTQSPATSAFVQCAQQKPAFLCNLMKLKNRKKKLKKELTSVLFSSIMRTVQKNNKKF